MKIKQNYSLKKHNTFCIDVKAKYYSKVKTIKQCINILEKYPNEKILILGGGSNTLLLSDWNGLVLKIDIKGKKIIMEEKEYVDIKVSSGENWDKFVRYTVKKDLSGIENLVMIPGSVGGAVAQNIGAYGQNIIDTIVEIEALRISDLKTIILKPKDCDFKYRSSKFKKEWKNKYIIIATTFRLKTNTKEFELSYHERTGRYGSLLDELKSFTIEPYTTKDVMKAVIRQRTRRLPSTNEYGTCGSFFENPLVKFKKYKELSKIISDLQCYPSEDLKYDFLDTRNFKDDDLVKIPAGRLLDELGWKNKWDGNVGVSEKHALCVVTNKKATGNEIYSFIKKMQKNVQDKYGIELKPEVNIISN